MNPKALRDEPLTLRELAAIAELACMGLQALHGVATFKCGHCGFIYTGPYNRGGPWLLCPRCTAACKLAPRDP